MVIRCECGADHEVYVDDDGSMDTVLLVDGTQVRYSHETAADFRRADGELDQAGLQALIESDPVCPLDRYR